MELAHTTPEQIGLNQRLKWLIASRLAIASVLLGATIIFRPGGEGNFLGRSFWAVLSITSAHLVAAIVFAAMYSRKDIVNRLSKLTFVQIVWDLLFTTALVYLTGGIESQFTLLYCLTIINAAILLLRPGAFCAAALSSIFYGALVNLQYLRHLPQLFDVVRQVGVWQETEVITSIVFYSVVFFAVAYVSGHGAAMLHRTEAMLGTKSHQIVNLEELMKRIVDSVTNGLVTLDADGRVNYWNLCAVEITGLSSEETKNRLFVDIFPQAKAFLEQNDVVRPETYRPWSWEMTFQQKDGQKKILGFSFTPLCPGEQDSAGRLVMFSDVTKYREMAQKVKRSDQLVAVGELAARMAHEIRNPLTSISAAIEMLRNQISLGMEDRRLMDIVIRETERLNLLLTEFLLFAKPTVPEFEEVQIDRLLRETSELFSRNEANQDIELSVDVEPNIFLRGDPKQLNQLVWNLIKNASESMCNKGQVTLRAGENETRTEVFIEVVDQGPGISPEVRERIFQPFFTTKARGTGLGLAIVHRIAEEHGGRIVVESQRGRGTTFGVRFPKRPTAIPVIGEV